MKRYLSFIPVIIVMATFLACEEDGIIDRSVDVTGGAYICFYNLSTSSPEINLYFDDVRVTSARSQDSAVLRGIPYRSTYPGTVTPAVAATTLPASTAGLEYFLNPAGTYSIDANNTEYLSGFTTYSTTNAIFADGKFYSIYAMNDASSMELVVAEDAIAEFNDTVRTKIRVINAVSGVSGDAVDVWMWHQPATGDAAIPPYKLAENLSFKDITAFCDTITAGNYKWIVTVAGAVPTENLPPAEATGSPYTLKFDATNVIFSRASTSAARRTTYTMLVFGKSGSSGVNAPFSGLFRNRLK